MKVGRAEEARTILGRLRSEDANPDAPEAASELADIRAVVTLERKNSKRNSYWNMFWGIGDGNLHIARRVQLSVWLQIIQE